MLEAAAEGRRRFIAWHEPGGGSRDATLDELIARGDAIRPRPAARAGQGRDPHLRHDRRAQGRQPRASRSRSTRSPRCWSRSRCARATAR